MPASFIEALMGMHVDTSGFESALKKAEGLAESATKAIAGGFTTMGLSIAAAVAGTVIVALEKAIKTTAEFGLRMDDLGARMGMTAEQAATFTGIMERYSIGTGVAARSMQMMAMEMKQTGEALDPLHTRLGRVLGTLRDSNGSLLNMSQVLDLARQKIAGASSATEQLQLAQQVFGTRMGGQLLPMLRLSNEEWEKQKKSVADSLGPVAEASEAAVNYKKATAELDQSFKGIELTIGSALLPTLTKLVDAMSTAVGFTKGLMKDLGEGSTDIKSFWLFLAEKVHLVSEGTAENYRNMEKYIQAAKDAAAAPPPFVKKPFSLSGMEQKEFEQYQKAQKQMTQEMEQAQKLGLVTTEQRTKAVKDQLAVIEEATRREEELLAGKQGGLNAGERLEAEDKILKLRIEGAQILARMASEQFHQEELQMKAQGIFNQSTEMAFLQQRLANVNVVGDERLRLEAELFEKRKKFEEESVKVGVQLGAISVDQEIAYRKKRAAELLGSGDVLGAAGEVLKARDLAMKQADEQMEFVKKINVVTLQNEIDFQRQKLDVVRGNAEEEMKIVSKIADLDKKLYDERLQFGLTYTQNIIGQYNKVMDAAKKSGEEQSFEQAKVDSERKLVEATREARGVLHGGGTEAARGAAVDFSQFVYKQVEQMQSLGKQVTGVWQDAADAAKDILKAASGGEEVRAPGGPSPTIGSIMSPTEGLATQGLARGSDIPRLDTSFTDLATRLRDVLNTNVLNLGNFGSAVQDAFKKISAVTGTNFNSGAVGPGGNIISAGSPGSLPNTGGGSATVAPPTLAPGQTPTTPSNQIGVGSVGGSDAAAQLKALQDAIVQGNKDLIDALNNTSVSNQESLQSALSQIQQRNEATGTNVHVTLDPGTGDLLVSRIEKELAP